MADPIIYRRGTEDDSYTVFLLFEQTLADLLHRNGETEPTSVDDPDSLAVMWEERRSLYEHLGRTAEEFWIAEQGGTTAGFARSILRDGTRELTELFVLPAAQSSGIGRELLERTFPRDGARHRVIIASPDVRAHARYLQAGVTPRFPVYYLEKTPQAIPLHTDLLFEPVSDTPATLPQLAAVDLVILGHRPDVDHSWLLSGRQGYLYYRSGEVVGYGYTGKRNGPFALLHPSDYGAVLAHAETQAAGVHEHFGVEVPGINRAALDHLLARRFQIDTLLATFMSNPPFGQFDHYIFTSPPFCL